MSKGGKDHDAYLICCLSVHRLLRQPAECFALIIAVDILVLMVGMCLASQRYCLAHLCSVSLLLMKSARVPT